MQGPEASSHALEARFDANMTGAAFACLLHSTSSNMHTASSGSDQQVHMQGSEASSHAHEAGYDAYTTGAAFACYMPLHQTYTQRPQAQTNKCTCRAQRPAHMRMKQARTGAACAFRV